ncbi:Uncharacterized protein TPAR_05570 [Tolypocladium paradoxum]|uniref:Uncharacterized protein n=1 Tax=Tolypocladium paradoxum TaxID=94208 RepID=A0A2S4KVP1_9HYPO|nr:Uncharacterized protein TPAR_05570 [Tolypocladium paradoxum]
MLEQSTKTPIIRNRVANNYRLGILVALCKPARQRMLLIPCRHRQNSSHTQKPPTVRLPSPQLLDEQVNLLAREAKEEQQVQQALSVQPRVRLHLHARLRVPRHAQPGLVDHQQVVGTVADGHDLRQVNLLLGGNLDEEVALALLADDGAPGLARELAVGDDNLVGVGIVDAQVLREPVGQRVEAAGDHGRLDTEALQRPDELPRTLGHLEDRSELVK